MRAQTHRSPSGRRSHRAWILLLALAVVALPAMPAAAGNFDSFAEAGRGESDSTKGDKGDKGNEPKGVKGKAKLKGGDAVAPSNAPKDVVRVIEAANKINKRPYRYGGGHKKFEDKGYDCSGAVSYALRGAKLIKTPSDSGGLTKYGKKGKGDWITVYAHGGHTYLTVAGLRFDTSSAGDGGNQDGPRWRESKAPTKGYAVRHPKGL